MLSFQRRQIANIIKHHESILVKEYQIWAIIVISKDDKISLNMIRQNIIVSFCAYIYNAMYNYHVMSWWHWLLTHWGRVTHICVADLATIGSENGLSPVRRQAIIWTNAGILLIGPLGTNFSETLIRIQTFSLKKMNLKMSSAKWRSFCLGLDVLRWLGAE